jgi:hypothetical protein
MRISTILRWTLLGSLVGMLGLWLLSFVIFVFWIPTNELVGILLSLFLATLVSLPCALTFERGRVRGLMQSGMIAAGIGVVIVVLLSIAPRRGIPATILGVKFIKILAIWSGLCALVGLMMYERMISRIGIIIRACTVVSASIMAFSAIFLIVIEAGNANSESTFRYFGVLGVLTLFGLLATIVIVRFRELTTGDKVSEINVIRIRFTAWCPRCQVQQELQTGGATCSNCGLAIKVMVP